MRRPPRSTQSRSSAASDVYKRQGLGRGEPGRIGYVDHLVDSAGCVHGWVDIVATLLDSPIRGSAVKSEGKGGDTLVTDDTAKPAQNSIRCSHFATKQYKKNAKGGSGSCESIIAPKIGRREAFIDV